MIMVNNCPILADVSEVINQLRSELILTSNIELFRKGRQSGNNWMYTCPFHKGGQERKPSFGISKVDGVCHCFACGWTGSLTEMISTVFGYDDNGSYGEKWLSRNFLSLGVEMRKPLNLQLSRGVSRRQQRVPGFTEEELDSYRYIHPYMYKRGLTDEIIEEFDIGYDARNSAITFPCYYADGFPAFIARRSVKTKYFNYPEGVEKPVYGADRFYRQQYDFAVICESVFNALTCWKWGLPAVALLGTGAQEQYSILRNMPVRKFILGLDPDEAGRKGSAKLRQQLEGSKIITEFDIPEGYDINDLDEKVLELKEFF